MEQKEKVQKPYWVQVVEKNYNPLVHQLVGNMCGSVIQGFVHIIGLDYDLAKAVYNEMQMLLFDNDPVKIKKSND